MAFCLLFSSVNPSVPDRFICVGARSRQFGEFRALRRECTRLRDRRMSWIVSKGRAAIFYHTLELEHQSNITYSHNLKKFVSWFFQVSRFFDFESRLRETARSWNLKNGVKTLGRRSWITNWSTHFKILWSLSIAQSALKFEKSWNLKKIMAQTSLILRVGNIWLMFQLQCMIEKPRPKLLTLSTTFYALSVSFNLFSKPEIRQIGESGRQRIGTCREPKG